MAWMPLRPWEDYQRYNRSSRSERWMLENLTSKQRSQYENFNGFVVDGKKRRYFLQPYSGYCTVVDDQGVHYCISARGHPDYGEGTPYDGFDNAVGLLLLIKFKERKFRRLTFPFGRTSYHTPEIFIGRLRG